VEAGRVLANELLRPDPDGIPRFTGLRPRTADRLRAAGWEPPAWHAGSLAAVGWEQGR
jgi:hypothetical protein